MPEKYLWILHHPKRGAWIRPHTRDVDPGDTLRIRTFFESVVLKFPEGDPFEPSDPGGYEIPSGLGGRSFVIHPEADGSYTYTIDSAGAYVVPEGLAHSALGEYEIDESNGEIFPDTPPKIRVQ